MAEKRTRLELRHLFAAGNIPSAEDFADIFASSLNQVDDGVNSSNGNLAIGGEVHATKFVGDGSGLTNISAQIPDSLTLRGLTVNGQVQAATFRGDGSGLTNISAQIPDSLTLRGLTVNGQVQATTYRGDGRYLENIPAPTGSLTLASLVVNGRVEFHEKVYFRGISSIDSGYRKLVLKNQEVGVDNSSRRYKHNIIFLEDNFRKIMQLQPRKYSRQLNAEPKEIGYIAEEVHNLGLTNLVYYDRENRPEGLDYDKICLYLLEILREHEMILRPDSTYLDRYVEKDVIQNNGHR